MVSQPTEHSGQQGDWRSAGEGQPFLPGYSAFHCQPGDWPDGGGRVSRMGRAGKESSSARGFQREEQEKPVRRQQTAEVFVVTIQLPHWRTAQAKHSRARISRGKQA